MFTIKNLRSNGIFFLTLSSLHVCTWANNLPINLYKQCIEGNENMVISPFGTTYAFAIAFAGSSGKTSDEIASVFGFTKDNHTFDSIMISTDKSFREIAENGEVELISSAAIWPDNKYMFKNSYLHRTQKIFGKPFKTVSFSNPINVCNTINEWAAISTNGKFNSIISPSDVSTNTKAIITSAVYFKGKWEKPFFKTHTFDRPFFLNKTDSILIPTMNQEDYFGYWADDTVQFLQMTYSDSRISMSIILPKQRDGLAAIEQTLSMNKIIIWSLKSSPTKVKIFLPRFEFSNIIDTKTNLQNLGIESAFDVIHADFSGISDYHDSLFIESSLQKSFILVDEEGTEASSIDAILVGVGGLRHAPPPIPIFRADHPFLFVISESTTGSVLFIGRVMDPSKRGH